MTDELGDDYDCPEGCGASLGSPTDLASHVKMCSGDGVPDGYKPNGEPESSNSDSEFSTADTMTDETEDTQEQKEATENDVQDTVESNYDAAWVGGSEWMVTDGTTMFRVHISDGEVEEVGDVHGAMHEAIVRHHDVPDLEHSTMLEWAGIIQSAEETIQSAEQALEGAKDAEVAARSAEADAAQNASDSGSNTAENTTQNNTNDDGRAQEAAERLQSAFDDVIDDMQVTASSGVVWIQTGQDTPDNIPGTGISTWEAFIKNPDQTEFVYESDDGPNHELFSEKPGEFWKNIIRPENVDEYIDENLEVSG